MIALRLKGRDAGQHPSRDAGRGGRGLQIGKHALASERVHGLEDAIRVFPREGAVLPAEATPSGEDVRRRTPINESSLYGGPRGFERAGDRVRECRALAPAPCAGSDTLFPQEGEEPARRQNGPGAQMRLTRVGLKPVHLGLEQVHRLVGSSQLHPCGLAHDRHGRGEPGGNEVFNQAGRPQAANLLVVGEGEVERVCQRRCRRS